MGTSGPSLEQIRRESRSVGFDDGPMPTLEAVDRRRLQLWALAVGLLFAVTLGVALISTAPVTVDGPIGTPAVLRIALVLLSVAFGAYAIEKEFHLRRLARLLMEQRVLTSDLTYRLNEMGLLLEAGKAMNSELGLPAVLDAILGSAMDLLSGESGSIMLLEEQDRLVTILARGDDAAIGRRVKMGSGVAGRAAESRTPVLVNEHADPSELAEITDREPEPRSAVYIPLIGRSTFYGLLSVHAYLDRRYTDYDLQVASMFAEQAAGAIVNARAYEAERMRAGRAELAREFETLYDVGTSA